MSQKIINVGSVANDGTGDTIRGAFTNVNANFTEVYSNISTLTAGLASIDTTQNTAISSAYNTTNAAFFQANTGNTMAYNLSVSANAWANAVGTSGNSYANYVGASGNAYAVVVGSSGNTYTQAVGTAGNAYAVSVGTSGNAYAVSVGTSGNVYASILAANNAIGANAWANAVGVSSNIWTQAVFTTLSNTSLIFNTANAAYTKANTGFANTTGTFQGNLYVSGSCTSTSFFIDPIGPVREKLPIVLTAGQTINVSQIIIIANSAAPIDIKVPDDNMFLFPANVGTKIDVHQYNTGATRIMANDAAVTVLSSNNWANIAGQYLAASIVKVRANTWILSGNLKT